MAPQSQLPLSVELTKLVSAGILGASKFHRTVTDILNSGSDPFAEENLTSILGRCPIADSIAASFHNEVGESPTTWSALAGAIKLVIGPGATVRHAMSQPEGIRAPVFSMVVQCRYFYHTDFSPAWNDLCSGMYHGIHSILIHIQAPSSSLFTKSDHFPMPSHEQFELHVLHRRRSRNLTGTQEMRRYGRVLLVHALSCVPYALYAIRQVNSIGIVSSNLLLDSWECWMANSEL